MPRGWWHAIRLDSRPLFGPASRFDEAPVDACRSAVESAVAQGFRPVLFIPRSADWPAVHDQLGNLATVVRLCIRGRHDETMRRLLYEPSPELMQAAAAGARLLVPEPEYGRALDAVFRTSLADFVAVEPSTPVAARSLRQSFRFVSRLNPYRRLTLELDHENAVAQLRQEYVRAESSGEQASYDAAIHLADAELRFTGGVSPVNPASMAVVAERLGLPGADQALWALVAELIKASTSRLFATVSEQYRTAVAELARSSETLGRIARWLVASSPTVFAPALRTRGGHDSGAESASPVPRRGGAAGPAVAVFVSRVQQTRRGLVIRLVWVPGGRPSALPSISVEINDRSPVRLDRTGAEWAADGSALTLIGMKSGSFELGWRWDRPRAEMRLRLRGEIETAGRRG